jgi:hypothetical protein
MHMSHQRRLNRSLLKPRDTMRCMAALTCRGVLDGVMLDGSPEQSSSPASP